jgi:hypothetical protein
MTVTSAKYTISGYIEAVIDGVTWTVPDDLSNPYRQAIAEWEAEGNVIQPYVPPTDYSIPTLTVWQRMTDTEADAVYAELQLQTVRFRMGLLYNQSLYTADPIFQTFKQIVSTALSSSTRADDIFARL